MARGLSGVCVLALFASSAVAQTSWRDNIPSQPRRTDTLSMLDQRIPEVSFDGVPFEQVMDWVAEITGANVVVRWQTLEDNGVDRDKPITIKMKNLRLSQVLWMIMNEAAGADLRLAYRASGSMLIMSTEEDLAKEVVIKVYDIADLLTSAPRFNNAATMDPSQALNQMGQGGSGGGGGGGNQLFQNNNQQQQNESNAQGTATDIQELIDLIQQTVEPDSWAVNGGTGQIYAFQKSLVVSNSLLVHQKIGGHITEEETVSP